MDNIKLKTYSTRQELYSATGERFEIYVQFILGAIKDDYIGTRIHKDNGIDGLIFSKKIKKSPNKLFSIYGPEKHTLWSKKFKKIQSDFQKMVMYYQDDDNEFEINFIFNFKLSTQEAIEINHLITQFTENYKIYDPDKLISLLENTSQIQNVVSFISGTEPEERELIDYNNHIFAGKALEKLISLSEIKDTGDKIQEVLKIKYDLLTYLCIDDFKRPMRSSIKKAYQFPIYVVPEKEVMKKNTKVNTGCESAYLIKKNNSVIEKMSKSKYETIFDKKWNEGFEIEKINEKNLIIKVKDLEVIFRIVNLCQNNLERRGDFNLFRVIRNIQYMHYFTKNREKFKDERKRRNNY